MTEQPRILPRQQVDDVGLYVEKELRDHARYDNREPLDESGVSDLLRLAAGIYQAGYADGMAAQSAVDWTQRSLNRTRTELSKP